MNLWSCELIRIYQLKLPFGHSDLAIKEAILKKLKIISSDFIDYKIVKQSIDARNRNKIKSIYNVDVSLKNEDRLLARFSKDKDIKNSPDNSYTYRFNAPKNFLSNNENRPIIIGAGPCGYFAALLLAQMGFRPLVLERGKIVKDRTIETFNFWRNKSPFNPESNVQFGEGGAGTFSDGKLYSQISDPQKYGLKVLQELVESGANPEILTHNRPHIGTFKLATVVRGLRKRIIELGGEIRFEARMEELVLERNLGNSNSNKPFKIVGIKVNNGEPICTNNLVIALGHSARDSFEMLHNVGVQLQPKLFAVGLRIEHPQSLIDKARLGDMSSHPGIGHAEYKLVHHASNGRSVYSFCMCPGGLVVGSTSERECVVTNGMSQHTRNERNANSALVVNILRKDLIDFERWPGDPLAGITFQRYLEQKAYKLGGYDYRAPAQRLEDFFARRSSVSIGKVIPSYLPGIKLANLEDSLPFEFIDAIKEALPVFAQRLPNYDYPDALLTAVETRTSSPVRVIRDEQMESVNVRGLFPAGEGAGYAGGILSAGVDGIRVAEAVARNLINT